MARIAFLLGPDFEDSEARIPHDRLRLAGHDVVVVGTEVGETVRGKRGRESFRVDIRPLDVDPGDFDALVIPGGHSPDHLRTDEAMVGLVRRMVEGGKLIAAICHGPQLLIEAGVVRGRRFTSWPSVRTDLRNAGAIWEDRQVVEDGQFISSRNPGDIEAFSSAILRRL